MDNLSEKAANIVNFRDIDRKQQDRWEKLGIFKTPARPRKDKKFYCLDMFPYPSGEGLHVGHPEGYTASDILCRYKRMRGFDVLHPMGWDAFGLPAENYALGTGIHPGITTRKNIANFTRQIRSLGSSYDWSREINTTDPGYYRWTQWIFLQLFKKGLAYESTVPINWCPSCKTGLANEEVFQGACERCGASIERKNLRQWLLKITAYAQRLLDDLEDIDWPPSTRLMQENWIGRSEGAEVRFEITGVKDTLTVFTTRPDTLYGATYLVMSPEHPFLPGLTTPDKKAEVEAYVRYAAKKSDMERTELRKEKTGVFTGSYAVNPLNDAKIPVWTADYVLAGYGTGVIMAVPAHDERDCEFAKKFDLPITDVVTSPADWPIGKAFCGDGIAVNSPLINGFHTPEAKKKIIRCLEEKGQGRGTVNFKLRDWVFSRQRYWGEPIPIVHCERCGKVAVPESELPVLLPQVEKFEPTGTGDSPLAAVKSWVDTKCPACSGPAGRETNTMPQWAGSCWYYLRYADPANMTAFCSGEPEKEWMPVDLYIGGAEHAVLHLLYARFWHKVLYDLGLVSTKEPFKKLVHQGMILSYAYRDSRGVYHSYPELEFGEAGRAILKATGESIPPQVEKMSKSKKNIINPDEIVERYGADAFRMYEMFMGPLEAAKPWDMRGIEGISRFLKKVWYWGISTEGRSQRSAVRENGEKTPLKEKTAEITAKELEVLRHRTIEKVTSDIENLRFNTAISALMIYFNSLCRLNPVQQEDFDAFLTLLNPFAPHITEELWQKAGRDSCLALAKWPEADRKMLDGQEVELGVQVNGKLRAHITVPASAEGKEIERLVLAMENVRRHIAGRQVARVIVIPKRLVSIVTAEE
ncbi:MAG: leucine--tRNA ligase [bacterium]